MVLAESVHSFSCSQYKPFSWKAAAVFLATGGGLYLYFQNEKKKIQERKSESSTVAIVFLKCRSTLYLIPVTLQRARNCCTKSWTSEDRRCLQAYRPIWERLHRTKSTRQIQSRLCKQDLHIHTTHPHQVDCVY